MYTTTTALSSSLNPSTFGTSVTLTATITPEAGGPSSMSGSVTFFNGSVVIGTATVFWNSGPHNGSAALTIATLPVGALSISATYTGDTNYSGSSVSGFSQTVDKGSTRIALAPVGPNPSGYLEPFTAHATVTATFTYAGTAVPTGSVVLESGGTPLATTTFSGSPGPGEAVANFTVSNLAIGTYPLTGVYLGDLNFSGSTMSGGGDQVVVRAPTTTALTSSANPAAKCQLIEFTAAVAGAYGGLPTGSVVFDVGGTLTTVTLASGSATCTTSTLSAGTHSISANYLGDGNFNTSTSSALPQVVNADAGWVATIAPIVPDPEQGAVLSFGPALVNAAIGALRVALGIDPNQHSTCGCGCGCTGDNCKAGKAPIGPTYCSNTVNVRPVFQAKLASSFCTALPANIQARLTWNGTAQDWQTLTTSPSTPGTLFAIQLQAETAVATTGYYPWKVEVVAGSFSTSVSSTLPVVVNTNSPFGAGWALAGLKWLLPGGSVAMFDNATGGYRYFTGTGTFTSPPNDQGTLVQNDDLSYTYTSKDKVVTNFDSSGRQTSQTDPHGLSQLITYTGTGSQVSTITQPDGGVATFSYSGGLLAGVQQPGGRALTMSYDGDNNLTGFIDAAGGIYTFTYDGSNRLVNQQVGPINTTYAYSTSTNSLTQIDRGAGTTLGVAAASTQGVGGSTALPASQAATVLTDALSNVTSYQLDTLGRMTQKTTADGAVQNWTLNTAGNPTLYIDQLGRATSNTYNGSQDLTQVQYPDGTSATMQYDPIYHQVTQIQNALNQFTTLTYSTSTSDLLTQQDAMGFLTTMTWSNGLMQTTTDALGRVTTSTWNSARQQLTTTDPLSHTTSFAYDGAGNQTVVEDALGRLTTMVYDGNRRLLTQTNALNGVQTSAYDAVGNQVSFIDELSRMTTYAYDVRGLQVSMTEAVGTPQSRTTSSLFDVAANLLTTIDALSEKTSYGYDVLNRPVVRLEAFGTSVQRAVTTVYDAVSNVLTTIDARATPTSYGYDVLNRQIQQIEAYGLALQRTTTTNYDAISNVLSTIDPRGAVTSYAYDANNRQTQMIEAYGIIGLARTTTTAYDAVSNVLSTTNALPATTSYGYDADNRQTQRIEAYGVMGLARTTTTAYDAVGNVTSTINPRGYATTFVYDALNRRVNEIDPLPRTLTMAYDAVSNLLSTQNGLGVTTSFGYDALNRRVTQLDAYATPLQRALTTVYDLDDNVTARIDAAGFATTMAYDALNRMVNVEDAGGGVATTLYDLNDNIVNTIDQMGNLSTLVYDVLNRKTQTIDARNGVVTQVYDPNNNLLSLTDPVGNQTQWQYDLLNRKLQETDPLLNFGTFAYDAIDRMTSATDRNAQLITYSYDALNRETGETWYNSGGTAVNALTFTFDPNNNLLTAANNAATNTMTYDSLDRTASAQGPFGAWLTFSYDAANNRTLTQDNFGGVNTWTFDALNRVTTIQFGGTSQVPLREDFVYTSRDQVATQQRYRDLAGSFLIGSSTVSYDAVARLTNLQHLNGTGGVLANYTNTYDLASRITAETLNAGAPTSYSYDATSQLTNDSLVSYSYDLNGNRTMTDYVTGPGNELTSDGTWDYFYDKNGNVVQKVNPSTGEQWSYGYDNRNRLITAQDTTGAGVQMQATYAYDGVGQRIEKDVWTAAAGSIAITRFAYDRGEIWGDLTSGNALQTRYLRGARVLELLAWIPSGGIVRPIQLAFPLAMPLGFLTSPAAWVLADRMGSVRGVVDGTGAVIDLVSYDGFGNVVGASSPLSLPYAGFGYRWDAETSLLLPGLSERYYDPATGIWLSRDFIGFRGGDANLARYVFNNPTNGVDPDGEIVPLLILGAAAIALLLAPQIANAPSPEDVKKGRVYGKDPFAATVQGSVQAVALVTAPGSQAVRSGIATGMAFDLAAQKARQLDDERAGRVPRAYDPWQSAETGLSSGLLGHANPRVLLLFVPAGGAKACQDFSEGNYAVGTVDLLGTALAARAGTCGSPKLPPNAGSGRVTWFYDPARGPFGPRSGATYPSPRPGGIELLLEGQSPTPRTWVSPFPAAQQNWWSRMMTGRGTYQHYVEFDASPGELAPMGGLKGLVGIGRYQKSLPGPVSLPSRNPSFGQVGRNYGQWIFLGAASATGGGLIYYYVWVENE